MQVKIVKENGETFECPESNLENVRRLIKYKEIIYPMEETVGEVETETIVKAEPKILKPAIEKAVKVKGKR
jgi:hypothetical protein